MDLDWYRPLSQLNLNRLLTFMAVVEMRSFRAAAERIHRAVSETLAQRQATPDLADQMEGATPLSTTDFAAAVIKNL